jgi:proteic killer suppression protein
MDVRFNDDDLSRLESDQSFTGGLSAPLVRGFRKAMQRIRAAMDERDLRTNATRFERLSGKRRHQYSIRINDQYRLILELESHTTSKTIVVVAIEDYH